MSFPALYTTLAVWGASGPSPTTVADTASTVDTVSITLTESSSVLVVNQFSAHDTISVTLTETSTVVQAVQITLLGVSGTPFPYYDIAGKAPSILVPIATTDALSVQWNEDPVTSNQITSQDATTRVTLSESSLLFNAVITGDTVSTSLSETIALVQVGVTSITAADTVSTTLTEGSAVSVTVATSDTTSITLTESSSLSTSSQAVGSTDSISVTLTEASLLSIFTGILQFQSADELDITLAEISDLKMIADTRPFAIRIQPLTATIRITPL